MKHLACGLVSCLLLPFLFFLPTASSSAEVTFSWVTVGDAGNACDPQVGFPCVGGLPYTYRISRFEVTNLQYAEFLNAVASEFDTFGIYDPQMGALPHGGIDRASQGGGFVYSVKTGFESRPVTYVSFWNALRFANWLHNGQPSGFQGFTTTEDGAYRILTTGIAANSIVSNPGARFFLPTRDEWHKAAYYDPGTEAFFDYPARSDDPLACAAVSAAPNTANCGGSVGTTTAVGAYTGSPSPYGTFDQGGNVSEWAEDAVFGGEARWILGSDWILPASAAAASTASNVSAGLALSNVGLRIATMRPPPPSWPERETTPNIGFGDATPAPWTPSSLVSWSEQDVDLSRGSGSLRLALDGCVGSACSRQLPSSCLELTSGGDYTLMARSLLAPGSENVDTRSKVGVRWYGGGGCATLLGEEGPAEATARGVWNRQEDVFGAPAEATGARLVLFGAWRTAEEPTEVHFDDVALSRGPQLLRNPFFDLDTATPEGFDFVGLDWNPDEDSRGDANSGSGTANFAACSQPPCTHLYRSRCHVVGPNERVLFGGRFRGNDEVVSHVIALEWFQDDDCDFPERALPSPPLASRGFWERQELSRVAPPGTQTVHMIGEVTYADGAELLTDEMYVVLLPEPEATLAGTALLGLALLRRRSRDRRWTGRAGVQKP